MRHFTVSEANALLPTLTPVLSDLQDAYALLQDAVEVVRRFEHHVLQNGHATETRIFEPNADLQLIQKRISARLEFIRALGVVVKDMEMGLIDFPTRVNGRDVYLCWHLGEESIAFWHEIDEGFQGRRPIKNL